jgi:ribonuclease VapC
VNLSEVVAKLDQDGVPESEIHLATERLDLDIHAFDAAQAYAAGMLRQRTRSLGLSFSDRACLSLALRLGAVALTADRSWARLDIGVAIEVIR